MNLNDPLVVDARISVNDYGENIVARLLSVDKMDKKDVNKTKNVYILGGIAFFLVLTAMFAFFFLRSNPERQGASYVFDGWYFGREDQKKVDSVLAAAGLDDYSWESGKLSVPKARKNEYRSALAVAGAYPKAPSESRLEALRESSVFESDSKLRMRELDACATQLERTIEQMRDVEYATVGCRSRRESFGLVAKNVVTASVGVALKDGVSFDSNFITAITIAAQHQLGIDEAADVSILDLKAGKSYLGVGNSREADASDVAIFEKERVENYWRDKYLEAFGDIYGVRVSVVADLSDASDVLKNENKTSDARFERGRPAFELRTVAYAKSDKNRVCEHAENEATVPLRDGRTGAAAPLTPEDGENSGFARLGNPKKNNSRVKTTNQIRLLATVGESDVSTSDAPARLAPLQNEDSGRRTANAIVATSCESVDKAKTICSDVSSSRRPSGVAQASYFEKNDSKAGRGASDSGLVLRSIIVRIAVPESYVQRVFQRVVAEKNKEKTFEEGSTEERESLYRGTETKILEETKKFAVALFRPTSDRLGWKDDVLENSFYVDVFSDASVSRNPDAINFVSKYSSFDVLETPPDSKERNDAEKSADSSDSVSTSSEFGLAADTLGKIAEMTALEEEDDKSGWGNLLRTIFTTCLKISKSKQTIYALIADVVAGLAFFLYVWRKKYLKKKKELAAKSAASSGTDSESSKTPNQKETKRLLDDKTQNADAETYDDELEQELLNLASTESSKRVEFTPKVQNDARASNERDFWEQRQTALDLIAKYPERAAASLQRWVKNPS